MSTINRTTLEIHVVHLDRRPIEDVSVASPGLQPKPLGGDRFLFQDVAPGRVAIRVESRGLAPVAFSVEVAGSRKRVEVVLGEPGLPTFNRRGFLSHFAVRRTGSASSRAARKPL